MQNLQWSRIELKKWTKYLQKKAHQEKEYWYFLSISWKGTDTAEWMPDWGTNVEVIICYKNMNIIFELQPGAYHW